MSEINFALQALKDGIIVTTGENSYRTICGKELYIVYFKNSYKLGAMSMRDYLSVEDYGKTWLLVPNNSCDIDVLVRKFLKVDNNE